MPPKKNNTWVQAVKEWQKQNPECPGIPRKDSKNYEEVLKIKADIDSGKLVVPDLAPRRKRRSFVKEVPIEKAIPKPIEKAGPKPIEKAGPEPIEKVGPKPIEKVVPKPIDKVAPKPKKPFMGLASAYGNRSIEHRGRYFSALELAEFKDNVKKGLVEDLPKPKENPYKYKKPKAPKKESIGLQAMPVGV
jgi:hypothetical protein